MSMANMSDFMEVRAQRMVSGFVYMGDYMEVNSCRYVRI